MDLAVLACTSRLWHDTVGCCAAEKPPKPGAPLTEHNLRKTLLLFFKFYDPRSRSLRYVHQGIVHKVSSLRDPLLADGLCKKAGLPPGTPLRAYEEVKPHPSPRLDVLRLDVPISQHPDIVDGDIICYEADLPPVR